MSGSSAMLPPTSFPHRRTRIHKPVQYPLSPPSSPDALPCGPPKMSLPKATSFHVPSSPPSDDDPVLSISHLPRRSSTASKTLLALMLGSEADVADSIASFERQFSTNLPSHRPRLSDKGTGDLGSRHIGRRTPLDLDNLKSVKESHEHLSDSGLGTSISSASSRRRSVNQEIDSTADRLFLLGVASNHSTSEADRNSAVSSDKFTTQGPRSALVNSRQKLIHSNNTSRPIGRSAITRSVSPSHTTLLSSGPALSSYSCKKVDELLFGPILREQEFSCFHPLVHSLEEQTRKRTIKCLRDLEKHLIFEPSLLTTSTSLFRRFGEFSIQLVLDTYPHLTEPEQTRVGDRPYDNGYFLDLVQQLQRLAADIGARRDSGETDEMAPSSEDQVTLEGGMAETGNVAELCRWKDGIPISLRTGERYEAALGIKRSASVLDEEVERSMARRKKGAEPLEMRCSDKTCGKIFTRKCDLAKHEKTHSRPFKCSEPECKYYDLGLPTEKERDRHVNDKHSSNPHYYTCKFCPFKTKRDSNCKQHMEKKHGWQYDRVKGNGKSKMDGTPQATPQATPQTPSVSTPVSVDFSSVRSSTASSSAHPTPIDQAMDAFPEYHFEPTTPVHLGGSLFGSSTRIGSASDVNPYNTPPNQNMTVSTPYSAISNITEQHLNTNDMDMYGNNDMNFTVPNYGIHGNYGNYSMASPYSPGFEMKLDPNAYTQMPMTPSTSSGHLAPTSRNPSVSLTAPISPAEEGLAQTISPPMYDDLMDFTAPTMDNNQFAFAPTSMLDNDIPTDDFNLFGSDGYMTHTVSETEQFETYFNIQEDAYEA